MEKILKWWKDNKVKPKVSKVFNLEDTKYALQALINREVIGKAVIKVR
jgi:NADPH:quinone reductase-like Zn-dependent oxidoreductase